MKQISPTTAHEWLQQDQAILIDVRETDEYEAYHIEGAQLAPLSILPQAVKDIEWPADKKIIFQCLKGGRSAQAIAFLNDNLLKNHDVYNLEGGILAWAEADLPLIKA